MNAKSLTVPPGSPKAFDATCVVLAISGGGFRGLFSARVLDILSARIGKRSWHSCIDLFAGTSVGAAIAAGLALGRNPGVLADNIKSIGPKVFQRWIWPFQLLRRLGWAPYSQSELEKAIVELLGDDAMLPLNKIDVPLLIPAVDVRQRKPQLFKSAGLDPIHASTDTVLDAILASTAAPTFFPPHLINRTPYADGGLVANAPDLVAIGEAIKQLSCPIEDLHLLSVGSGAPRIHSNIKGGDGVFAWIVQRRLVQTTLAAQEELTVQVCQQLLGERYHRINPIPGDPKVIRNIIDLDNASPAAAEALEDLAATATRDASSRRALDFFSMLKERAVQAKPARRRD